MRKYNVQVNGKTYLVEVEDAKESTAAAPAISNTTYAAPVPISSGPVAAASPVSPTTVPNSPTAAASAPSAESNGKVKAPLPGKILEIRVSVGDKVTYNQPLCVLEAMKMENEICAPMAGTVSEVHISQGDTVDTDHLMFIIA